MTRRELIRHLKVAFNTAGMNENNWGQSEPAPTPIFLRCWIFLDDRIDPKRERQFGLRFSRLSRN